MSIVTFWNDSREQSGKTLSAVAIATNMAIERNSKILLISTSVGDPTIKNCFWGEDKLKNKMFGHQNNAISVESGIEGLLKLVTSNKLTPSSITDYTKIVFKDRLEVLLGPSGIVGGSLLETQEDFRRIENYYVDLIRTANQYYDIVIVDLDKMLTSKTKEEILKLSDVNIYVFSQRLESLNKYNDLKNKNKELMINRGISVIGKYIKESKYNSKNVARYLQERRELDVIPLNLLYMAAAEEAGVVDLFLRLKNVKDKTDENYIFMQNISNLTNNIWKKLQDMKLRMR